MYKNMFLYVRIVVRGDYMEVRIIVIIAILSVIIVVCAAYLWNTRNSEKPVLISDSLIGLFDSNNIVGVEFIRNKLVVSFTDASLFDANKLKEFGGKGISIIGDKIKFFISDKSQDNERLYIDLVKFIEG